MKIYDEENLPYDEADEDMLGYTVVDEHSIYKSFAPEPEPETIATPIPENEQTVILSEPKVAGVRNEAKLELRFSPEGCCVFCGEKKIGCLKEAFVKKLLVERGGQKAEAFFRSDIPPMVRIVFGEGDVLPAQL